MNKVVKNYIRHFLPRSVRPQRILGGPLRGSLIVTSWHDYPAAILGRTEGPLLRWFAANVHPGETWLDIGAHYGYTAIALAGMVGPQGKVYAFEPMTATAGCVARSRSLNGLSQLTIVPVALGNCESIASRELPTVRGMLDSTTVVSERGEQFFVAGLDWLWPRIARIDSGDMPRIHGIKMDVQGMEIEALMGMQAILQRFRPKLVIEIHKGVSRQELLSLLQMAGYPSGGSPLEAAPDEPEYTDDHSYAFSPA